MPLRNLFESIRYSANGNHSLALFNIHSLISLQRSATVKRAIAKGIGQGEGISSKRDAKKKEQFLCSEYKKKKREERIIKTKQVAHFDVGMIDDKRRTPSPWSVKTRG